MKRNDKEEITCEKYLVRLVIKLYSQANKKMMECVKGKIESLKQNNYTL